MRDVSSSNLIPKGKLFLHLGLPKTATTSLQYEILSTQKNSHLYLGKFQGRPGFFHQILSNYLEGTCALEDARMKLAQIIGDRSPTVYSNEMLMVDSILTWREKLAKLGILFEGFDVVVIMTLRQPSQLGPSLYAELKPTAGWSNFDSFLDDPQSDVLDPLAVEVALSKAGLSNRNPVCYVEFDTLVASRFSVIKLIIPNIVIPPHTAQRNTRMRKGNLIVSRNIGLYDVVYSVSRRLPIIGLVSPKLRRWVGSMLRSIPLRWSRGIEVPNTHRALDKLDLRYSAALAEINLVTVD